MKNVTRPLYLSILICLLFAHGMAIPNKTSYNLNLSLKKKDRACVDKKDYDFLVKLFGKYLADELKAKIECVELEDERRQNFVSQQFSSVGLIERDIFYQLVENLGLETASVLAVRVKSGRLPALTSATASVLFYSKMKNFFIKNSNCDQILEYFRVIEGLYTDYPFYFEGETVEELIENISQQNLYHELPETVDKHVGEIRKHLGLSSNLSGDTSPSSLIADPLSQIDNLLMQLHSDIRNLDEVEFDERCIEMRKNIAKVMTYAIDGEFSFEGPVDTTLGQLENIVLQIKEGKAEQVKKKTIAYVLNMMRKLEILHDLEPTRFDSRAYALLSMVFVRNFLHLLAINFIPSENDENAPPPHKVCYEIFQTSAGDLVQPRPYRPLRQRR